MTTTDRPFRFFRPRRAFASVGLALAGALASAAAGQSLPQRINDSGQTSCHAGVDPVSTIACDGNGSWPGQDGASGRDAAAAAGTLVKIGGGAAGFDFTKLSNAGDVLAPSAAPGSGAGQWACTRDNTTGLVWQAAAAGQLSWSGARHAAQNAGGLCGLRGWRLPTTVELQGLVHYGQTTLSLDSTYFTAGTATFHWTGERHADGTARAWVVHFGGGFVNAADRDATAASVRLVSGGGDFGGLRDNGDGTVTDPRTGLMWDRCALGQSGAACGGGEATAYRWQSALQEARTRNSQNWRGHADWRLPNVKELASLIRHDRLRPAIDTTAFPAAPDAAFWTSSTHQAVRRMAWAVFFGEGDVFSADKDTLARIRLVRTAAADATGAAPDALFGDDFDAVDRPPQPPEGRLPVLAVTTAGGAPIGRDDYVAGQLAISAADPSLEYAGAIEIRGRGNSTWDMPKKPYRIRLVQKAPPLGMPENRHWVLLANYGDKSLLRNHVAFEMGRRTRLAWTPRAHLVEVTLNGDYIGQYQLTEQIRVGADRVDITELEPEDVTPETISGGYLLELDGRRDCAANVQFDTSRGVPYCIDTPDAESIAPAQYAYIRNYVQSTENAIYGATFTDPTTGYAAWLDTATFVDWYLVNELMMNQDARDWSSIWSYKDRDGKLSRGPLWDFDISSGNANYGANTDPRGWWIRYGPWYGRLFEDPAFAQAVRARWNELKADQIDTLLAFIDAEVAGMGDAPANNFQRWPILAGHVWPNGVVTGSYEGEVAYFKDWLIQRIAWLDANL